MTGSPGGPTRGGGLSGSHMAGIVDNSRSK